MKPEPYSRKMLKAWRETQKAFEARFNYGITNYAPLVYLCQAAGDNCKPCVLGPKCMGCARNDDCNHPPSDREYLRWAKRIVMPKLRRRGQLGNGKQHET